MPRQHSQEEIDTSESTEPDFKFNKGTNRDRITKLRKYEN